MLFRSTTPWNGKSEKRNEIENKEGRIIFYCLRKNKEKQQYQNEFVEIE